MPHSYSRTEQVRFLTEWFDTWSEMQREDFLPIMIQAVNPADHVNGLVGVVGTLTVGLDGGRRPSLFDCQVKLFQDWYENWTPTEKESLLEHFNQSDPDFATKLEKARHSSQTEGDTPQTSAADVDGPSPSRILPAIVSDDDNKDDGVSPGSHSSSPLSSLSQPLSPHDSGLEETHSDSETTPPPNAHSDTSSGEGRDTENATPTPGSSGAGPDEEEANSSLDPGKESSVVVVTDVQEAI